LKILLVGGAGFIGSNLALKLKNLNHEVEIIDSLQVNSLSQIATEFNLPLRKLYLQFILERIQKLHDADIPINQIDARNYYKLSLVVDRFEPEVIIHLAAVAHASKSNKNPYNTFDHSLITLENSLDAASKTCKQFIYFSSSMVYGTFENPEVFESDSLKPLGIYGCLKVSGELMTMAYKQVFDMPYTIIRPSALYGERCVSRRVVQQFIENAMQGKPLKIEGTGQESLDFTYIDDLIQGVCLAIGNEKAYNQSFNITYGSSRSILDVAGIVNNKFNTGIEYTNRDKLMPVRGTLNINKARALLGYKPQYSIDDGVRKYINWYKDIWDKGE